MSSITPLLLVAKGIATRSKGATRGSWGSCSGVEVIGFYTMNELKFGGATYAWH